MQLQGRELAIDMQGADVRLLQFELQLLDPNIPDDEIYQNRFGPGTQQAVREFQIGQNVNPTGVVDRATAAEINRKLGEGADPNDVLSFVLQLVEQTVEEAVALDPAQAGLPAEIERLGDTLGGLALALFEVRDWDVDENHVADVETTLAAGRQRLGELREQLRDRSGSPGASVVSGTVRRQDGLPLAKVQMRAYHEAERGAIGLGQDTTDGEGRYTIRYQLLPGLDAVNLRVSASGQDGLPLHVSNVIPAASALEIVDLEIPLRRQPTGQHRIEGRILLTHGQPAEDLHLRLYRRGFGGQAELLAETHTLTGGQYAFTYAPGTSAMSLEVRVVTDRGEEQPLSKPLNHLGREPTAELNLVAPGELQPLAAEYDRLAADLTDHVGQMARLAEAQESEERQDLTVLNRATGWDARLIALAATAERLRTDDDLNLPSVAIYGLLRAGLPSNGMLLAQLDPSVVERALQKVRDAGIVDASDQQIAEYTEAFTEFSINVRMNIPAPGSRSTYGELLSASGLPQDAQDTFGPIYLNHRGDAAQLWENARQAGLDDGQVRRLQLQGKLAFLAGNSEALTSRLLQKDINDPAQLVEDGLHSADAWQTELLEQAGIPLDRRENLTADDRDRLALLIPPMYEAEEIEDRLRVYAEDMARKVRLSYPTQVVGKLLETDDNYHLPADHEATVALLKSAAQQGFRLGQTPVAAFLQAHTGVTAGLADEAREATRQQLETLQRVYQVTPNNEAMPVLLRLGLTSAYDVTAYTEEEFVELYAAAYQEVYDNG